jgi:hypothetical protein
MEQSERRGDRLRVVTMYTGAGAVDYGYERTTRRMNARTNAPAANAKRMKRPTMEDCRASARMIRGERLTTIVFHRFARVISRAMT